MLVTLLTDFDTRDGFSAVLKGVILNINPAARVFDITHSIPRGDIHSAGFVLANTAPWFPPQTIHLVVVDPGVGTDRLPIVVELSDGTYLVGPDNGLFSRLIAQSQSPWKAWRIDASKLPNKAVSNTFHGRDIFAPAAALLSLSRPPHEFCEPLSELTQLSIATPVVNLNTIEGCVQYIDHYGNLITDIPAAQIDPTATRHTLTVNEHQIVGVRSSYVECDPLGMLIGSHGYLEIAAYRQNARQRTAADIGTPVVLQRTP